MKQGGILMVVEFKLPDVGEGMHEGEIIQWLIQEGDWVEQDQPVVEVQTDKVNAELTAPTTGKVNKILFSEGETVEVGRTIFTIQTENDETSMEMTSVTDEKELEPKTEDSEGKTNSLSMDGHRILATPYVRQMAREMKVDIEKVMGTGPAGRVTEDDLKAFVENKPIQEEILIENPKPNAHAQSHKNHQANMEVISSTEKELVERIPLKGMRKRIAEHMSKSVSTIPHVTHVDEIEMDVLKELRDQFKGYSEEKNIKLTFLPFFIKAIVIALKEFKMLNSSIDEKTNEIILKNYYHIGIATDTNEGLIVPVIKDADRKSIFQLAEEIRQLAAQAREGTLGLEQITGGTFTISNVGPVGGLHATPIINHPEAAILALHKMEPRMVVREGEGVIRMMMYMSLSFDHRLIDGVTAVRFTNRIKELVENPNLLLLEMR